MRMVSPSLRVHGRGIHIPFGYAATAFLWEHPQKKALTLLVESSIPRVSLITV